MTQNIFNGITAYLALHEVWYWFARNRHKPWIERIKKFYEQLWKND